MVTREQLRARGRRAYELGRLRKALRVAIPLAPIALWCVLETRARGLCACFGLLLLMASIGLRWKSRSGAQDVSTGLVAGSAPLLTGLLIARIAPSWLDPVLGFRGTWLCAAAGAVAGVLIAVQETRRRAGIARWAVATNIALLGASLGCLDFGAPGLTAVASGALVAEGIAAIALARSQRG